jgi:CRISPR-associated protein Cas5d
VDQKAPVYRVRIRGELACFTRPELKTERVSYEIITPSAARGVLEAVLWKPAICWRIHRILVLRLPGFVQIRRNEVTRRAAVRTVLAASRGGPVLDYYADDDRAQRNTVALRDVDFAVEASFRLTARSGPDDNIRKFEDMIERRLERGQFHMQPYLGTREFPAIVERYEGTPPPVHEDREYGEVLHDIRYTREGNTPVFFRARMVNGIVEVPEWEDANDTREPL